MGKILINIVFTTIIFILLLIISCAPPAKYYKLVSSFVDGIPNPFDTLISKSTSDTIQINNEITPLVFASNKTELFTHKPHSDGQCNKCHISGGGMKNKEPDLCFECHEDFRTKYKYVHGPAASFCTGCHNPHSSKFTKLLKRESQDLCLYCHNSEQVFGLEIHSDIGTTDCKECHNAHGGNERYLFGGEDIAGSIKIKDQDIKDKPAEKIVKNNNVDIFNDDIDIFQLAEQKTIKNKDSAKYEIDTTIVKVVNASELKNQNNLSENVNTSKVNNSNNITSNKSDNVDKIDSSKTTIIKENNIQEMSSNQKDITKNANTITEKADTSKTIIAENNNQNAQEIKSETEVKSNNTNLTSNENKVIIQPETKVDSIKLNKPIEDNVQNIITDNANITPIDSVSTSKILDSSHELISENNSKNTEAIKSETEVKSNNTNLTSNENKVIIQPETKVDSIKLNKPIEDNVQNIITDNANITPIDSVSNSKILDSSYELISENNSKNTEAIKSETEVKSNNTNVTSNENKTIIQPETKVDSLKLNNDEVSTTQNSNNNIKETKSEIQETSFNKKMSYADSLIALITEEILYEEKLDSILEKKLPKEQINEFKFIRTLELLIDFNKTQLISGKESELIFVIEFLKHYKDRKVEVIGHTDNIGTKEYNNSLSLKRAEYVKNYLLKNGVNSKQIIVKGYGFSRPLYSNETEEGRAKNRRIEFKLIG